MSTYDLKWNKKERQAGVDLLRLIAVLMISTGHYLSAWILNYSEFGSFNTKIARMIEALAVVSVNLFILISGYFGINSKGMNLRRIVNMLVMIAFFSCGSYLIQSATGQISFHFIAFLKSLIPYMFEGYWFIRVYLILSVIAPFLNVGLIKLEGRNYLLLLALCFCVFSVLPSFSKAFQNGNGFDIIHFVFMYALGGYIKLHMVKKPRPVVCFLGYIIFGIVTFLFSIYGDNLGYWAYDFISVVPESVFLFLTFVQIRLKSRPISFLAKSSLAVFVTENSIPGLYKDILKVKNYMDSSLFLLHFIGSIICFTVFALCLDCVRRFIFKYSVDKILDRIPFINRHIFTSLEESDTLDNQGTVP